MKSINLIVLFLLHFVITTHAQIFVAKELKTSEHRFITADLSDDGKNIASATFTKKIFLWNMETGLLLSKSKSLRSLPLTIRFSKNNKYMAVGCKNSNVYILDAYTLRVINVLKGHKKQVVSVDISPDEKYILSASEDKTIRMWDLASKVLIKEFKGHQLGVLSVDFNADGSKIVSSGADKKIILWDVKSGLALDTFVGHKDWVRCVRFSTDDCFIASAGDDKNVITWDVKTKQIINTFSVHKDVVYSLDFSPDDKYLICGSLDKYMSIIDLSAGKMLFLSEKNNGFITNVGFNSKGDYAYSSEFGMRKIKVWDVSRLEIQPFVAKHKAEIAWISPKEQKSITTDESVRISACINSESPVRKITVMLNGAVYYTQQSDKLNITPTGNCNYKFEKTIMFTDKNNEINLIVSNSSGDTTSQTLNVSTTALSSPVIVWAQNITSENQIKTKYINLKASIFKKEPLTNAELFWGDSLVANAPLIFINDSTYSLEYHATIKEGANLFKIVLKTTEGLIESFPVTITCNKPKKPAIVWNTPATDDHTFFDKLGLNVNIFGEIPLANIMVYNNDKLIINGNELGFDTLASQASLLKEIELNEGNNAIKVVASCQGWESYYEIKNVKFTKPTKTVVEWIDPVEAITKVHVPLVEVKLRIISNTAIKKITTSVNNVEIFTDVQLKPDKNGVITYVKKITLNEGDNSIKISAENLAGITESENRNYIFEKPYKPIVTCLQPSGNKATVNQNVTAVKFCINSNIKIEKINLLVNNISILFEKNIPTFENMECSYMLEKYITLNEGLNQVQVSATNEVGTTESALISVSFVKSASGTVSKNTMSFNEKKFALIIGNEDYKSLNTGLNDEVNVPYAQNDALAFKDYCIKYLGIPEENIILRVNASTRDMKNAIKQISTLAKVDSTIEIIFYYAGHGLPHESTKIPYLIPVDVTGTDMEQAISLKDLYASLTEFPCKKVTVFLDACFSGGARDGALLQARAIKIKPKEETIRKNMVVFNSSSGDQSSLPFKDKQHGMFTYFLLNKIEETGGKINYEDLSNYLFDQVSKKSIMINNKEQSPQVNPSSSLNDSWKKWTLK